ncbi:MAG: 3-phosphoshikimate 1-carboxyvinyltransferase [Chitinophagaceae bacterium]|nr:3-phosphoshikimate 1-carboxyvinyltransferase [Chitinophagaceae bacterium]
MKVKIKPSRLKGTVEAPASKSSMQRACAAALLSNGTTIIRNPGQSHDDKAALDIIQRLGAKADMVSGEYQVVSWGLNPAEDEINCGESGLSIRMFTPIAALAEKKIIINGEGSLQKRPMDFFDTVLPALGVKVKSHKGFLPIEVRGPMQPATVEVDGSQSSQFLTGLLMAYGAAGARDVSIHVKNLKSKPYISLTLSVMKQFGLKTPENRNFEEFYFSNEPFQALTERQINYTVEGDWSGAAFLLVAGAIAGPITVRGLDLTSDQADKAILDLLINISNGVAVDAKGITVHPVPMKAFEFDATDCPDLFPPLVALAAYCEGESVITGVQRLANKESDRAEALQEEFGNMGVKIKVSKDKMYITGGGKIKGAKVHSHFDHRIAMACAVAALGAEGETVIRKGEAISKSYPRFYDDLQLLGASVSLSRKFKINE